MKYGTATTIQKCAYLLLKEMQELGDDEDQALLPQLILDRLKDLIGNGMPTDPRYSDETNEAIRKIANKMLGRE